MNPSIITTKERKMKRNKNGKKKVKYEKLTTEEINSKWFDKWFIERYGEDVVKMLSEEVEPYIEDKNFREIVSKILIKLSKDEKDKDKKESMESLAILIKSDSPTSYFAAYIVMGTLGYEIVEKIVEEIRNFRKMH